MELDVEHFDVPAAMGNALTLVRERAQRHGIALGLQVAADGWRDARRRAQVQADPAQPADQRGQVHARRRQGGVARAARERRARSGRQRHRHRHRGRRPRRRVRGVQAIVAIATSPDGTSRKFRIDQGSICFFLCDDIWTRRVKCSHVAIRKGAKQFYLRLVDDRVSNGFQSIHAHIRSHPGKALDIEVINFRVRCQCAAYDRTRIVMFHMDCLDTPWRDDKLKFLIKGSAFVIIIR